MFLYFKIIINKKTLLLTYSYSLEDGIDVLINFGSLVKKMNKITINNK